MGLLPSSSQNCRGSAVHVDEIARANRDVDEPHHGVVRHVDATMAWLERVVVHGVPCPGEVHRVGHGRVVPGLRALTRATLVRDMEHTVRGIEATSVGVAPGEAHHRATRDVHLGAGATQEVQHVRLLGDVQRRTSRTRTIDGGLRDPQLFQVGGRCWLRLGRRTECRPRVLADDAVDHEAAAALERLDRPACCRTEQSVDDETTTVLVEITLQRLDTRPMRSVAEHRVS